jgi:hypothetical protein
VVRDVGREARSSKTREPRRKKTSTSKMGLKAKRKRRREGRAGEKLSTKQWARTTGEKAKLAI